MSMSQEQHLGAQVREARTKRGWTGRQLADAAGVAAGTVVRIERGNGVRPGNLRAVLDALGIEPGAVVTEYTPDVETAVMMLGAWLSSLGPTDRSSAIRDLGAFIAGRGDRG